MCCVDFRVSGVTTSFFLVLSLLLRACFFPQTFGRMKFTCFDRKTKFFLGSAYHELQDFAPRQVRNAHNLAISVISRKARSVLLLFLGVNISFKTESWLQVAQRETNLCERNVLRARVSHLKGSIMEALQRDQFSLLCSHP